MLNLLSHRGFLLVSLISLMNAVVRTGGLFALIPLIATATLGLSVTEIGFAMMVSGICGFVAAYPAGWLADRIGRKAVIVPSTVLTGMSMVLFCYAPSYAWFMAASIVWSVAASISSSAPAAYVADTAPAGMNASAMTAYRMTADAGYVHRAAGIGLACRPHQFDRRPYLGIRRSRRHRRNLCRHARGKTQLGAALNPACSRSR